MSKTNKKRKRNERKKRIVKIYICERRNIVDTENKNDMAPNAMQIIYLNAFQLSILHT